MLCRSLFRTTQRNEQIPGYGIRPKGRGVPAHLCLETPSPLTIHVQILLTAAVEAYPRGEGPHMVQGRSSAKSPAYGLHQ